MAFAPIAFVIPEYDRTLYSNWWLKAYEPGTTTPQAMATDSTGGTTAAKFQLNTEGFPITAGNALVVPHVDGDYDLWLFPTAAEADDNDTTNALQFADNLGIISLIQSVSSTSSEVVLSADTVADMKTKDLQPGQIISTKGYHTVGDGGGAKYLIQTAGEFGGTPDGYGDHTLANGNVAVLQVGSIANLEQYGASDGVECSVNIQACLDANTNVIGGASSIYIILNEISVPQGRTFDLNQCIFLADPDLASTSNVMSIGAIDVVVKNGIIDGNRANLNNTFTTGVYGNGLAVVDGASNVEINNIETRECPTNGQLAVSLSGTISDIRFINYNSHDNSWTGIGGESQVNGNPLRLIQYLNGSTFNNNLGGDIRIQGVDDFLISGHQGIGGNHGGMVIGVGEAKNVTRGKIVSSLFKNNNIGLPTIEINGMVGGSGPFAGQIETIEVEMDNNTIVGAGGNNGLLVQNEAFVFGGTIKIMDHSINLNAASDSLVSFDNFVSSSSTLQACDIDTLVELRHVQLENWGAGSSAVFFRANSSGSVVKGNFGAASGETGKDGVNQVGNPSDIRLTIDSFTGTGLSKGLISGAVANTWEINERGANNMVELEDGILAPAAEVGRAKLYIDIGDGNLKLLKGDGEITTFDPIVSTTAELEDITSAINTDGRKKKGLYVHNDTTNKAVFANSNLSSDVWLDAQGVVIHTPV